MHLSERNNDTAKAEQLKKAADMFPKVTLLIDFYGNVSKMVLFLFLTLKN